MGGKQEKLERSEGEKARPVTGQMPTVRRADKGNGDNLAWALLRRMSLLWVSDQCRVMGWVLLLSIPPCGGCNPDRTLD